MCYSPEAFSPDYFAKLHTPVRQVVVDFEPFRVALIEVSIPQETIKNIEKTVPMLAKVEVLGLMLATC